jgi:hypothetical protein
MPVGQVPAAGTGTGPSGVIWNLAVGSLARCSTAKRSIRPLFQAPCCGPQSWVMSFVVWPSIVGGVLVSSNGHSACSPSASRYAGAGVPVMDVPTKLWRKTEAGSVEGPPAYEL